MIRLFIFFTLGTLMFFDTGIQAQNPSFFIPANKAEMHSLEKKYKNIVFDLGGVLVDDKSAGIVTESLFPGYGIKVMHAVYRKYNWNDLDRGTLSVPEFAASVENLIGVDAATIAEILETMPRKLPLFAAGLELLHTAKAQGYKIFALTNAYAGALEGLIEEHNFFKLFDGIVSSCDEQQIKPEAAIYKALLKRFNLQADETIFIDDVEANAQGGAACGIDSIVCKNPQDVLSFFRAQNILRAKPPLIPSIETKFMPATPIKAEKKYTTLIFDLGGVLIDWKPEQVVAKNFSNQAAAAAVGALFHDPIWLEFDKGLASITDLASLAAKKYFFDEEATRKALTAVGSLLEVNQPCVKILEQAKKAGYKLYVLSNHPAPYVEDYIKVHPQIFGLFDGMTLSCDTQMLKPDPAIYQSLLKTYKLSPTECLFIDDVEKNIKAGNALGIDGIVCGSLPATEDLLISLKIIPASSSQYLQIGQN